MRGLKTLAAVTTAALFVATSCLAGPVTLKAAPSDDDGRVTLGDVFDGAGSAANVVIANRAGPSVVFDAGQLQAQALHAGLQWTNPQGLSRVVVRAGAAAPATASTSGPAGVTLTAARPGAMIEVLTYARNISTGDVIRPEDVIWTSMQAHQAPSGAPGDADQAIGLVAKRPLRAGAAVAARDLAAPRVIARNDMVEVAFVVGGIRLTVQGRATRDAAVGEALPITNSTSGRLIDAVATGPGTAIAGPAAIAARSNPSQFAAR